MTFSAMGPMIEPEKRIWEAAYAVAFARNWRFKSEGDSEWAGHTVTPPGQDFEVALARQAARVADGAIVAMRKCLAMSAGTVASVL
jgi:hypothetical protein